MLRLYDGDHLEDDLALIAQVSQDDADLLDAFLTQISESQDALWALTKRMSEHPDPLFNERAIECFQSKGYNVYRIRPLRFLSHYRIIYAFDAQHDEFYVLAVTRKKPFDAPPDIDPERYNYEPHHPLSQRICDEYDALGIPRLPVRH